MNMLRLQKRGYDKSQVEKLQDNDEKIENCNCSPPLPDKKAAHETMRRFVE